MEIVGIICFVLLAASIGGAIITAERDGYHRIPDRMATSTLEARQAADLYRKAR